VAARLRKSRSAGSAAGAVSRRVHVGGSPPVGLYARQVAQAARVRRVARAASKRADWFGPVLLFAALLAVYAVWG